MQNYCHNDVLMNVGRFIFLLSIIFVFPLKAMALQTVRNEIYLSTCFINWRLLLILKPHNYCFPIMKCYIPVTFHKAGRLESIYLWELRQGCACWMRLVVVELPASHEITWLCSNITPQTQTKDLVSKIPSYERLTLSFRRNPWMSIDYTTASIRLDICSCQEIGLQECGERPEYEGYVPIRNVEGRL